MLVLAIFPSSRNLHTIQSIGPIENKICEVMEKIPLKKEEDWNMNRLEYEITLAANQINRFEETSIHCGYQWG